jgi:fructokinase
LAKSNLCNTFANVNKKQQHKAGGNRYQFRNKTMNKKQTKILAALAAIAMANKDGFTVNAANLQPVKSGYAVAVAYTQNSFGFSGLANVVKYVSEHPEINAFGGWYNSENNMYYIDATVIVNNLDEAKELGRINKQIAIFDLANLKEIRL